jgi:acyl dehydratase
VITMGSNKTSAGNFFEDFSVGQVIAHAVPRTVTDGDRALYTALYGTRCAVQSSDAFARAIGFDAFAAGRHAGVPRGIRQDRAGHLAECGGEPGLC